jgi:hypothetical protein
MVRHLNRLVDPCASIAVVKGPVTPSLLRLCWLGSSVPQGADAGAVVSLEGGMVDGYLAGAIVEGEAGTPVVLEATTDRPERAGYAPARAMRKVGATRLFPDIRELDTMPWYSLPRAWMP